MKVNVKVSAETMKNAKDFLNSLPSFDELFDVIPVHPMNKMLFQNSTWEFFAETVNKMVNKTYDLPLYTDGYMFSNSSEKGVVILLNWNGEEYEITSLTVFKAIIMMFLITYGVFPKQFELNETHQNKMNEFLYSSSQLYSLLN